MECHEKLKMVEHCCKVLKDITCSYGPSREEKWKKVILDDKVKEKDVDMQPNGELAGAGG